MSTTADNKTSNSGPDIKQLADRELPKASFPGDGRSDFRIALEDKVHKEIQKHAKEKKEVEICGVLVGNWGRDDKGPFVAIKASIRGEAATSKFAEVTFTHDTWSKINAEMDKSYPNEKIVGWYHTHPDFGIFLSDRDRFIHENFFSEPGQVAYVVDPVREIEGFFIWQSGKPVPAPFYWTGEKMRMAPAEKDPRTMKHDDKRVSSSGDRGRDDPPPMEGGMLTWATLILGGLCLFMLGFMVSQWLSGMERQRFMETMQNVGALQLVQRMTLAQKLSGASLSFREAASVIDQLSRNAGPLDANQKQLVEQEVNKMVAAGNEVDQLQRQFAVTSGEIAALNLMGQQTQLVMDNAKAAATQSATTQPLGGYADPGNAAVTPNNRAVEIEDEEALLMSQQPAPMRISDADLMDARVEGYLEEQAMIRRAVGEIPDQSLFQKIFYSSYFYLGLAGLIGALVGWGCIEPFFVDHDLGSKEASHIAHIMLFPVTAAAVGLFLGAAEGIISRNFLRALLCGAVGLGIGFAGGLVALFAGGIVFMIMTGIAREVQGNKPSPDGMPHGFALFIFIVGRAIAWSLAALPAGMGQGIALREKKVIWNGILGAVLGGLLGGMLFDPIDLMFKNHESAAPSRAIGLGIIGLMVGVFIGLVEQWTKTAWLLMRQGPLAGKQFVLYRQQTTIGSSPKADIYLFKDDAIEPQHALLHNRGGRFELEDCGSRDGTYVNGLPIKKQMLKAGDQIVLGKTVLEFAFKEVN